MNQCSRAYESRLAKQYHNVNTANKSFKCLGRAVWNHNCIHEETKHILYSGSSFPLRIYEFHNPFISNKT